MESSTYTLKERWPQHYLSPALLKSLRLKSLHDYIFEYLGNRLYLAPLDVKLPTHILELGSGSGAWAIGMAQSFQKVEVQAVDKAPFKSWLPSNVHFVQADIIEPLPFEAQKFDVIHIRLVLMHVPQPFAVLTSVLGYLKPDGWLLVEEPDDSYMLDRDGPLPPYMDMFKSAWHKKIRERGAEPCIGGRLEGVLTGMGCFSEVNVRAVDIPLSEQSSDPLENNLGIGWKRTMKGVVSSISGDLFEDTAKAQIISGFYGELDDKNRSLKTRMYFTWSRLKPEL